MSEDTMKCLMKSDDVIGYKLVDIDIPTPCEGELLICVLKVSMCGSDIALYDWNEVGRSIATLPFIPGHECVGEVVKVGTNCPKAYHPGVRICCENHFFCGNCYQCLHNEQHICQNLSQYGHGRGTMHGGFSQYSIIPAKYAYILKTNLDVGLACLLEPFGVAHQGVEKLCPQDETVLIQGCGPIGLYCISLCKHFGAKKVIATDIVPTRLDLAKRMGADVVINGKLQNLSEEIMKETANDGVGRLIEASGAQPLVNNCFQLLRKGGVVVLIGIPKAPLHVDNVARDVLFKSLTLHTIHGRKIFHTWEECETLLHSGVIDIACTVSHSFPMTSFEEAFRVLKAGTGCKIMVDPHN